MRTAAALGFLTSQKTLLKGVCLCLVCARKEFDGR